MARPAIAIIDLSAIRHNYLLAKSTAPNNKAIAIIKANAYGHGAIQVANALSDIADAFGVACLEEAIELRQAGISLPILLLEGFFSQDELKDIDHYNLWSVIHSSEQIDILANASLTQPLSVWLKMDTGMHRLGIHPTEYAQAYQRLQSLPQVAQVVAITHFASADNLTATTPIEQINQFDVVVSQLNCQASLANSAATLALDEARRDWQRPGIMLYGASPFSVPQPLADQLQPVMTLSSKIISVRDLDIGDAVGYGATWQCAQPSRIGTVAMGYADGYPRQAKNGTPVLVNGHITQLVGTVSMDMLAVDLTNVPDAKVGSPVELWGKNLKATEVANYCETIAYTLFTGITQRVHKHFKS